MAKKKKAAKKQLQFGNCYQFAYDAFFYCDSTNEPQCVLEIVLEATDHKFNRDEFTLVHGDITDERNPDAAGEPFGHAWLEAKINGRWHAIDCGSLTRHLQFNLRKEFYRRYKIVTKECEKYTLLEACKEVGTVGTYGPWTEKQIADLEQRKARWLAKR